MKCKDKIEDIKFLHKRLLETIKDGDKIEIESLKMNLDIYFKLNKCLYCKNIEDCIRKNS